MFCFFPWLHKIRITDTDSQKLAPPKLGEYYIVRDGAIYYIGKTVNLRRRMLEHQKSGKLQNGDIFYYRIARWGCSEKELSDHERKMIAKYHPPGNKSSGGEGRVRNKRKYWVISGGLQLFLLKLLLAAALAIGIKWIFDNNSLLQRFLSEFMNLVNSFCQYLTGLLLLYIR